jgi:hypothetical protein
MTMAWAYNRHRMRVDQDDVSALNHTSFAAWADAEWIKALDELGCTGWELVSDEIIYGGDFEDDSAWVEFSGTLKRQGEPLS